MRRENIVIVSDLQVGSTVGLWPKNGAPIEGGGIYLPNKPQLWIAECWANMLERVAWLNPKPIVILNGDMTQGVNGGKDGQINGVSTTVQLRVAYQLLEPLKAIAEKIYVMRGSEFHDGLAGQTVEGLASELGAVPDPVTGQFSTWELYHKTSGGVIHVAHHVGKSSVPGYEATVPWREGHTLLAELSKVYRAKAPDVRCVVFSHRHRPICVGDGLLWVMVTPGWQLKTALGYRSGTQLLPSIGWGLIRVEDGRMNCEIMRYELPLPHIEGGE